MAEPRYRYSGRRSPTFNPARASMPVSVGYNPHHNGDLHAVQTGRYDTAVPRRATDHKTPANPTTTITTYNVTKEQPQRASNTARRRSSTVDSGAVKPIIVTTNHTRPTHGSSSHATSSAARTSSPSRDPYRSSDETYYAQPASSIRSRSRHGHGYTQSATLSNDEYRRLRERVGDDRLRAPAHTATDYYRYALPHTSYTAPSHDVGTAVINYENEGYEYTKPSDLARYDLDHDRQPPRRGRRDSFDRPYFRPTVNVVSNDPGRYDSRDSRSRGPPPASAGIERYNRAAASGIYDRPSVTMPALPPPVPAPPAVDPSFPLRRIEAPRDVSDERRNTRPRPVSLYQDAPARMSHTDDIYRSHDDEHVHRRRERDDAYLDDAIPTRGFGIRTDSLEVPAPDRPARSVDRRDYDDRRVRRDTVDHEPRRRSDESVDYTRTYDSRKPADDDVVTHVGSSRDDKDGLGRKNSIGGRARDKFAAGLGAAAVAMGLAPKEVLKDDDHRKVSPRGRDPEEDKEAGSSRAADRYKPREKDVAERRPSPREDDVIVEPRREPRESRREPVDSIPAARDREVDRERIRERMHEREQRDQRESEKERERERERDRDRDRDRERELEQREREKERDRERERRDERRATEAKLNGSAVVDSRDDSPASDGSAITSRRRPHNSSTFDPRDTRDLLNVKAELAAKDGLEKPKEKLAVREQSPEKETVASISDDRQLVESREESRGREVATSQKEEKQVRVVSPPPREKLEQKPIKGILKTPKTKFPEEDNPVREGVAPHKDDKTKKDVPAGARWTKVNRKLINPAALEIGKERYEIRDDFVIVLRVLSKEEIQAYATATAQIREAKRKEFEKEHKGERDYNDRDRSDEEKRVHRRRRDYDEDNEYRRDRERDDERERERHRRHRHGSDSDDDTRGRRAIDYDGASTSRHDVRRHRSHRDRDYDSVTANSEDRR